MRVLMMTPPSPTRLHHLAPLAWALRVAGHEALIASEATFTETINLTGLVAASLTEPLAEFASVWRPAVILWDQQATAGAELARRTGALSVCLRGWQDHRPPSTLDTPAEVTVDSTPPSKRVLPGDGVLPLRHIPYNSSGVVPSWLRRRPRRPRIYVHETVSAELYGVLGRMNAEVVCATRLELVPAGVSIPDNMRILDSAPLAALLPACSAVIHSGDAALAAAAAYHGLPQLVFTPSTADLPERVESLISDPALLAAAQALRDEALAMPSPREFVPELAKLAARRGESMLT
jgi:UDP:flavonoid glycosyltransferase YjiC (YdhE family)